MVNACIFSPTKTGNKGRMSIFTTIIPVLAGAPREKKEVKDIEIGKETKFSLFVDDMIVSAAIPRNSHTFLSLSLS